jgi:hypothetical protein
MSLKKALARTVKLQTKSETQLCTGRKSKKGDQQPDNHGPTEREECIRGAKGKGKEDRTWLTSIPIATVNPNPILHKLKIPDTMEAHVISADAANMNCSRRRR